MLSIQKAAIGLTCAVAFTLLPAQESRADLFDALFNSTCYRPECATPSPCGPVTCNKPAGGCPTLFGLKPLFGCADSGCQTCQQPVCDSCTGTPACGCGSPACDSCQSGNCGPGGCNIPTPTYRDSDSYPDAESYDPTSRLLPRSNTVRVYRTAPQPAARQPAPRLLPTPPNTNAPVAVRQIKRPQPRFVSTKTRTGSKSQNDSWTPVFTRKIVVSR